MSAILAILGFLAVDYFDTRQARTRTETEIKNLWFATTMMSQRIDRQRKDMMDLYRLRREADKACQQR